MTGWFYVRITHEYALYFKIIFRYDDAYTSALHIIRIVISIFKIIRGIRERTEIHCLKYLLILLIAARIEQRQFVVTSCSFHEINWATAKLLVIAIARRAIRVDWRSLENFGNSFQLESTSPFTIIDMGERKNARRSVRPIDLVARGLTFKRARQLYVTQAGMVRNVILYTAMYSNGE